MSQPESRVELQLAFEQNIPGKYFTAIFFWAYEDVISQWIPICQNVHSGADSVCLVGLGFWDGLVVCSGAAHWFGLVSPGPLTPGSEHQCASFWALSSCMNMVLSVPC